MNKTSIIFRRIAGKLFIDIANYVADYIGIDGVATAVAVNTFPEPSEYTPSPYIAMTIRGKGYEIGVDLEDRLFERINAIIYDLMQGEGDELFCVGEHPGLVLTVESNTRDYAYIIIAIELPPEVKHAEIDEMSLMTDIVNMINDEMPKFPYDEQSEPESDPAVGEIYGIFVDPQTIHSYSFNAEDE